MKKIDIKGITYIEPLDGSYEWYWGMDYASGDLYEAEELFKQGKPMKPNRLIFIHYPDGRVVEPIVAKRGQYFGQPIFYHNQMILLMVDFTTEKIEIITYEDATGKCSLLASLSLSNVEDCYNVMLKKSPLMLTRQGMNNRFQILWPENMAFDIENTESFYFRIGEKLYFSSWYEDPDYREEVIVRKANTGEIIDRFPGNLMSMPDGQIWWLA